MTYNTPPQIDWAQSHKEDPDKVSFLDLPRELRDLVYEFAYLVSGAIFIYSSDAHHVRRNAKATVVRNKDQGPREPVAVHKLVPIALTRVCRQTHAEGIPILYSRNTYRLYASNADFAPRYRGYVRHIIFTTDSMIQKIFDANLEIVGYWWRRHFWPDVLEKSRRLLQTYAELETLTFTIKSSRAGETWTPAFIAGNHKTREQRVALAAGWLRVMCPFGDEPRLRECLRMEIVPTGGLPEIMYEGSRFYEEDEWDCEEFAEAFVKMKSS